MIGADGQVFVVPAWGPGIAPEPSELGAVQRLDRAGLEAADPSVAYKWLTGSAGERTILALVQRAAGHPARCLGVVWAAAGPASWSLSAAGENLAYTDRRNDTLYVYNCAGDSTVEYPAGDLEAYLATARLEAPEGWGCRWVSNPSWLAGGPEMVIASNRHESDFANGLSLWLAAPDREPRPLWLASVFGSGSHLVYLGRSEAGYLVYEARSYRVMASPTLGGDLAVLTANVFPVSLSADGRWLAFQRLDNGVMAPQLMLLDLTAAPPSSYDIDSGDYRFNDVLVWSPAGTRLAFLAPDPADPAAGAQLVVVDLSGPAPAMSLHGQPGGLNRLFPPSWADETRVLVTGSDGRAWIITVTEEGGQ